jgi:hypothetical protein
MGVPPKMMARMDVIARLGAFALDRMLVCTHWLPRNKKPA